MNKNGCLPLSYSINSRLVQFYGYKYDYKFHNIYNKCVGIPEFLMPQKNLLTHICLNLGIINNNYIFNQCIVNNYYPGQGISKHIDIEKYGDVIGCFSLNSNGTMIFKKGNNKVNLLVKPNSLYIMSGDSRYKWLHKLFPKKNDVIDNIKVKRERRISVTFRNVPKLNNK